MGRAPASTVRLAVAVLSQAVVMIEVAKAAAVVRRKFCRPAAEAVSSGSTEESVRLVVGMKKNGTATPSTNCGKANCQKVASTVKDLGAKDFASDGMECDSEGRLYLTDYEHNAVRMLGRDGEADSIVVQDARMIWPDSMAIGTDGYLYFTANQLNRQKQFHQGKDLRKPPYALFKVKTESKPVVEK